MSAKAKGKAKAARRRSRQPGPEAIQQLAETLDRMVKFADGKRAAVPVRETR